MQLCAADLDAEHPGWSHAIQLGPSPVEDSFLRGETPVAVVDNPVEDDLMQRFNDPHVVDGRVQVILAQAFELAAREAGAPHRREAMFVGPRDGLEDVWSIPRTRYRQQQVPGRSQVFQLLQEDAVVTLVVGPGHDARGVVGQAQDAQTLLVFKVAQGAFRQVFAQVRSIRARAAVADDEDKAALIVRGLDQLAHLLGLDRIKARFISSQTRDM